MFASFPLFLAARLVRRSGQPLRVTLREPVYEQCFPGAVLALGLSLASNLLTTGGGLSYLGQALIVASIAYFFAVETGGSPFAATAVTCGRRQELQSACSKAHYFSSSSDSFHAIGVFAMRLSLAALPILLTSSAALAQSTPPDLADLVGRTGQAEGALASAASLVRAKRANDRSYIL